MTSRHSVSAGLWLLGLLFGCQAHASPGLPYQLVAGSDNLCQLALVFLNEKTRRSQPNFELLWNYLPPPGPQLPPPLKGSRLVDFDFDNDSNPDQVFVFGGSGSYINGTIFYVRKRPSELSFGEPISIEDLKIYPCQFDPRSKGATYCPPYSQVGDEMGIEVTVSGTNQKAFFRGRYTEMTPIRSHDRTFIVLKSNSGETKQFAAVIEPKGGASVRSVCLFRQLNR